VYYGSLGPAEREGLVTFEADHVDGTMGAATRDQKLSWLKGVNEDGNDCRILCNVRCLSKVSMSLPRCSTFLSARTLKSM
jgi:predicted helicase